MPSGSDKSSKGHFNMAPRHVTAVYLHSRVKNDSWRIHFEGMHLPSTLRSVGAFGDYTVNVQPGVHHTPYAIYLELEFTGHRVRPRWPLPSQMPALLWYSGHAHFLLTDPKFSSVHTPEG